MTKLSSIVPALALLSLGAFAGCAESTPPPQGPIGVSAPPSEASVSGSFAITAQNSKIEWTGAKTSGHHDGGFAAFTGKIDLAGPVEQGKVSLDIDTSSLTVNDPALGPMQDKLAGHLKSPDFFDVAKFPKATFVSSGIKVGGEGGAGYTISGTLSLHGASKAISFPANITPSATKVDATATFNINRKDFGLTYPGKPDDLIKDDVQVRLTIHADKT